MGPWNTDQINQARRVQFSKVLDFLGAHYKRDLEYQPLDPSTKSIRVQVGYEGRDYRFILTGEKWFNELLPETYPNRGGGGAIDPKNLSCRGEICPKHWQAVGLRLIEGVTRWVSRN